MTRSSIRRSCLALFLTATAFIASNAGAVGTRTFRLDSMSDLKGGDLTGVSVDSRGNIRAGLNLGATPITDASSVWSSVVLPDGAVLLGTGNEGKVYRVNGGQASLAATTGQMAVSSMALAWNNEVILGTFPEGKLYKMGPSDKGGAAKEFVALPGTEDIWALVYDAKAKVLYAATGPEGKVYRIDQAGKAQVYYDSEEPHLVSLAQGPDGSLYAGSNGKGLLYKITAPGRATVLHDFDSDDVKAIRVANDGSVYAIANKYSESFSAPKRTKLGPPTPQSTKAPKPGKGVLVRIGKDGVAEPMLDDKSTHFVSLALGDDGLPYVGTGAEGRVYTVDDTHLERLVADTDERQVGAIVIAGKRRFLATSDPLVFHEIKGVGGPEAVWTSKVLDAGLRASFGRLIWRSQGSLELSTRSGNTKTPDATWSAWSPSLNVPGDIKSPSARYVQIRARWNRDPAAVLREVELSFVTDNARPIVTSIEAAPRGTKSSSLKMGIVASGGEAPKPTATLKISWKVDNLDEDELLYRLSYRLDGQTIWHSVNKPSEKITRTEHEWDTSAMPEGIYRIKVEASDELANPPDRALRHSLESGAVLVDNTPPVFKSLALNGRRLSGEIVDGLGPISRIEVSAAGSDEWRPIFPSDGVFDEPAEPFSADISRIVPAGPQLVTVRAYDSAGNLVVRAIESK